MKEHEPSLYRHLRGVPWVDSEGSPNVISRRSSTRPWPEPASASPHQVNISHFSCDVFHSVSPRAWYHVTFEVAVLHVDGRATS